MVIRSCYGYDLDIGFRLGKSQHRGEREHEERRENTENTVREEKQPICRRPYVDFSTTGRLDDLLLEADELLDQSS
jgi:hypothetical protein